MGRTPPGPQKELALWTPGSQTSILQNCERGNSRWVSPLAMVLVTQPRTLIQPPHKNPRFHPHPTTGHHWKLGTVSDIPEPRGPNTLLPVSLLTRSACTNFPVSRCSQTLKPAGWVLGRTVTFSGPTGIPSIPNGLPFRHQPWQRRQEERNYTLESL